VSLAEPEEGFKVIDRRRRDSAEDVAEVSAVAADTDRQSDRSRPRVLVLLRHKTEGHRTAEETQTLESVTYDVQVRYAEAMKRTG
jgi:hypothetical protein